MVGEHGNRLAWLDRNPAADKHVARSPTSVSTPALDVHLLDVISTSFVWFVHGNTTFVFSNLHSGNVENTNVGLRGHLGPELLYTSERALAIGFISKSPFCSASSLWAFEFKRPHRAFAGANPFVSLCAD